MPTILMIYGFRFFFYSREESRMHIHVEYQGRKAKIWLDSFEIVENHGFYLFEIKESQKLTRLHEKEFKEAWLSHFR